MELPRTAWWRAALAHNDHHNNPGKYDHNHDSPTGHNEHDRVDDHIQLDNINDSRRSRSRQSEKDTAELS
jgi:hypothetical protein